MTILLEDVQEGTATFTELYKLYVELAVGNATHCLLPSKELADKEYLTQFIPRLSKLFKKYQPEGRHVVNLTKKEYGVVNTVRDADETDIDEILKTNEWTKTDIILLALPVVDSPTLLTLLTDTDSKIYQGLDSGSYIVINTDGTLDMIYL